MNQEGLGKRLVVAYTIFIILFLGFSGLLIAEREVHSSDLTTYRGTTNDGPRSGSWISIWENLTSNNENPRSIATHENDTIVLTGSHNITKRHAGTGEFLWNTSFRYEICDLAFDSKHNFAVIGRDYPGDYQGQWYLEYYNGYTNEQIWSGLLEFKGITCSASSCEFDSQDRLIIVGKGYGAGTGADDAATVAKYYPNNGTKIWHVHDVPGTEWAIGYSDVAIDSNDNIIACGNNQGFPYAARIRKYDTHGNILWSDDPGSTNSRGHGVAVDSNGNILFGMYESTVGENYTISLIKYSPDGEVLWRKDEFGLEFTFCVGGRAIASYDNDKWLVGGQIRDGDGDLIYYFLNKDGDLVTNYTRIDFGKNDYISRVQFDNKTKRASIVGGNETKVWCTVLYFKTMDIASLEVLRENKPTSTIYSRVGPYTFRVKIIETISKTDLGVVRLSLDPPDTNVHLMWSRSTGQFSELSDPHDYITLDPSSNMKFDQAINWTINFNVIFNWDYPNEGLRNVSLYATSAVIAPIWNNITGVYEVVNKVVFNGTLSVKTNDDVEVKENDIVISGAELKWSGLTPIYQGSDNVYPPAEDFDVTVWDSSGNSWSDAPAYGEAFYIQTTAAFATNTIGDLHVINISGLPSGCDASEVSFNIKIDGDNVTYLNPTPKNFTWQTTANVKVGVTITDVGGTEVDGSSIMHAISIDDGTTWSNWKQVYGLESAASVIVEDIVTFPDGRSNLLKWKAKDTIGNGPRESEAYRVLMDTENVIYSGVQPHEYYVSSTNSVTVNVSISDNTSGVDASTIEYSVSDDGGTTWGLWTAIPGLESGLEVDVGLNLSFPNGTENRIKWRAADLAGNGPVESKPYTINVNSWLANRLKVSLISPIDTQTITSSLKSLVWVLEKPKFSGVTYDVYLDNVNPPESIIKSNLSTTDFTVTGLTDQETYYWTVIPKIGTVAGACGSGVWSFVFDKDAPVPEVKLVAPGDEDTIYKKYVELQWEPVGAGTGWTYNVFFDEDNPPLLLQSGNYNQTSFMIDGLEDGKTYYWTVMPISDQNVYGAFGTTIWSISVDFKSYGVSLETIDDISITPGESTSVSVKITNIGAPVDTFVLDLNTRSLGDQVTINGSSEVTLQSGNSTEVIISITISKDTRIDDYPVRIDIKSLGAEELGLEVSDTTTFTIYVKSPSSGKSTDDNTALILSLVVVFVIVIILIIIAFLKLGKKKKPEPEIGKKDGELPKTKTTRPGETRKPTLTVFPGVQPQPEKKKPYTILGTPPASKQAATKPTGTVAGPALKGAQTTPTPTPTQAPSTSSKGLPASGIAKTPPLLPKPSGTTDQQQKGQNNNR